MPPFQNKKLINRMTNEKVLVYLPDPDIARRLETDSLQPAGYQVTLVNDRAEAQTLVQKLSPDLIILGDQLPASGQIEQVDGLELAASLLQANAGLAVILIPEKYSDEMALNALRAGVADILHPSAPTAEILQAVTRVIARHKRIEQWARLEVKRNTKSLQEKVETMEALQQVGRAVTASLDLDSVLTAVVGAAVELAGAEEGSLLLLDEATGELYMRASRTSHEDVTHTHRLPVSDTLASEVLNSGKPLLLDKRPSHKIKTSYLVHNLIYVPIIVHERTIGVLSLDNRLSGQPFSDYHLTVTSTLAGYAAVAIENARLFARSEQDRNKFETILTHIKDGVIVVDHDSRLLLLNQTAAQALGVQEAPVGKPAADIFQNTELLELLTVENPAGAYRSEITLEDGRVFNAQVSPIPEVGLVVTMQDISYLKELDRIKSDFVNTVSHDLRSPLTAILGYVELIDRVGPINAQQKEFIRRVGVSVQNITALINDLLDLGRIEAGFDTRNEIVPMAVLIQYTLDGLSARAQEKHQTLEVDIAPGLPAVLGNPVRLRQMLTNLLGNAIKYTQEGGRVRLHARCDGGLIILQIIDNGPGIPASDQPFIFDKFYRASNIPMDVPGTGLGLAIVKSIVEYHQGRIWVESSPGGGATFTIVLPVVDQEL